MNPTIEEIRINDLFTSKVMAEYPDDMTDESTPIIRRKHIRTDTYVHKILDKISPFSSVNEMIPVNCRLLKKYQKGMLVVIEEPPAMRSVRIDLDMYRDTEALKAVGKWKEFGYENFYKENSRPYTFMLAMPYVIHILHFSSSFNLLSGKVGFRTKQLLGPGDELYKPPLLNISEDLTVCYGPKVNMGPRTSIAREAEHVLGSFWGSCFNSDYINNYHEYEGVAGICDYFTWQYYSHINPMFIYQADWIPFNIRVGEIINNIENDSALNEVKFGYKTLLDLISRPTSADEMVKSKSSNIKRKLYYDLCDGWHPEIDLCVNVGDSFVYNKAGDLAFVDSYMGVEGSLHPKYIRVFRNGKLTVMKITSHLKKFIVKKIKETRYEGEVELPDKKTTIKAGDIVQMTNLLGNRVYKKVHYIRKAVDGKLEIRLGSEFYFLDAIDWSEVEKVDISNLTVDGIKLNPDSEYLYRSGRYMDSLPFATVDPVKFSEISAGNNNSLLAGFCGSAYYNEGQSYKINMGNAEIGITKIFLKDATNELPDVFFIGRRMFSVKDRSGKIMKAYKHNNVGVLNRGDCYKTSAPHETIMKEFLNEDGTHFHAESFNLDIDFHIGDKVVVADWKNPLRMLSVRTLMGFKTSQGEGECKIHFILEDKHGKLEEEPYVNGYFDYIKVGKIRKVTNKIDEISVGTKIQAKVSGISCFPKKDINVIVAFIIDTGGEPLVLCSNGCTLWYEDMLKNFERTTMRSKKWKTMEHAPLDPSKIKLQAGDIINGTNGTNGYRTVYGYLVSRNRTDRGMIAVPLQYYSDFDEHCSYSFDSGFSKDVILDCIPNPRISGTKQTALGSVSSFPTLHGMFTETFPSHSPYNFTNEPGRIIPNV